MNCVYCKSFIVLSSLGRRNKVCYDCKKSKDKGLLLRRYLDTMALRVNVDNGLVLVENGYKVKDAARIAGCSYSAIYYRLHYNK